MSRILFYGDLATTGFGTVTGDLGDALLGRGEDVRFVSFNEGSPIPARFAGRVFEIGEANGWLHMPESEAEAVAFFERFLGLFTGASWADGWTPEAAILLGDAVAVKRSGITAFIPEGFPAFHYSPIEGVDLPPRWAETLWRKLRPVAMSEFGADEIAKVTGERPPVVYHGVNSHVFRPVSTVGPMRVGAKMVRTRAEARSVFAEALLPGSSAYFADRTWLLRTDRHMPRKQYNAMLRSLVPVFERQPNVDLVIHCETQDQGGDLEDTLSKLPDAFRRRVILAPGQMPRELLVLLYNAADLYVSNCAEGFGLCIAEALACGTPAVGAAYSAVPEVIGPAGLTVPAHLIENEYDHYWAVADDAAFGEAVADLIAHPLRRARMGEAGVDHVRRSFRWDRAAKAFSELIAAAVRQEVAA